jgi:hypothetical protein
MSTANGDAARARYNGSVENLIETMRPHMHGPRWITYAKDVGATLNEAAVVSKRGLVCSLRRLQGDLSFTQASMESALAEILKTTEWVKPEEAKGWCEKNAKRLRVMLRHVSQATLKSKGAAPKWLNFFARGERASHRVYGANAVADDAPKLFPWESTCFCSHLPHARIVSRS